MPTKTTLARVSDSRGGRSAKTAWLCAAAYGLFYSPPIGNDFRSRGFQDPFAFLVTRTYRPASTTSPLPEITADGAADRRRPADKSDAGRRGPEPA